MHHTKTLNNNFLQIIDIGKSLDLPRISGNDI